MNIEFASLGQDRRLSGGRRARDARAPTHPHPQCTAKRDSRKSGKKRSAGAPVAARAHPPTRVHTRAHTHHSNARALANVSRRRRGRAVVRLAGANRASAGGALDWSRRTPWLGPRSQNGPAHPPPGGRSRGVGALAGWWGRDANLGWMATVYLNFNEQGS